MEKTKTSSKPFVTLEKSTYNAKSI